MSDPRRKSLSLCRFLIVGPPLAGKGTQSRMLSTQLGIPHISSGDILREEAAKDNELSRQIKEKLARGELIPDDVVRVLVNRNIAGLEDRGFILDGYPRTLAQLEAIDFHYDRVLFINTSLDTIMERAKGRLYHPKSGRIYHTKFSPPLVPGLDDKTAEPLVPRGDDKEEIVRHRFLDFMDKTGKVIEKGLEMNKVSVINGDGTVAEVNASVLESIQAVGSHE